MKIDQGKVVKNHPDTIPEDVIGPLFTGLRKNEPHPVTRPTLTLSSLFLYTCPMQMQLTIDASIIQFELPPGVDSRLQELLDRQDEGIELSPAEKQEAEGLVELAEFLSLLRLRAARISQQP